MSSTTLITRKGWLQVQMWRKKSMKLKLKFGIAAACLTFLTGCSIGLLSELAAPAVNFGLGLYNADTYYSKECAWYEPVRFSPEMKAWLSKNTPPPLGIKDLAKVAKNNDLYKEVCPAPKTNPKDS